ncbi:hypothetical protein H2201_006386 [Coniosporium apollinis]|uniref:Cyanovirin-N domain-containing protein n=2 Tax=Coniosporium TaxID=2810619 RepID=A0ABQ9NR45_9PEZI|nr:hypothetical protein H2199_004514 [Cladosporium sp. JES 115]KAJ9661715.1 hypothetical protein H2201_006386 [Coniosporium apollinis]
MEGRPPNRAPSWSWASIDGKICYWHDWHFGKDGNDPLITLQCEILDCKVQLQGLNPFGEVSAGALTLRGRLKHALVGDYQRHYEDKYCQVRVRLSIFDDQALEEIGGFQLDDWGWIGREVWCIPLLAKCCDNVLQCLALLPTGSEDPMNDSVMAKEFTRVGMLWMFGEYSRVGPSKPLLSPVHWFADAAIWTITVV